MLGHIDSVTPFSLVACVHLWLEEAAELAVERPSHAVALNDPALNNSVTLKHAMDIYPNAFLEYFYCNIISVLVLLLFCSSGWTPKVLATSMSML